MITLTAKILGKKAPIYTRETTFDDVGTLRELITAVVHQEVDAYNTRQEERRLFRVMTARQIGEAAVTGRIDPAAKDHIMLADAGDAVETALTAFEDGLFFVFVDGEQKEELDEVVPLDGAAVQFVRLTPLIGG